VHQLVNKKIFDNIKMLQHGMYVKKEETKKWTKCCSVPPTKPGKRVAGLIKKFVQ
jgi:hypothetical protein